jgi:hypothetical protein
MSPSSNPLSTDRMINHASLSGCVPLTAWHVSLADSLARQTHFPNATTSRVQYQRVSEGTYVEKSTETLRLAFG